MKRLLALLLCLVMALSLIPAAAAEDIELIEIEEPEEPIIIEPVPNDNVIASGTCGSDVEWELHADGELCLLGEASPDYPIGSTRPDFYAYRDQITSLDVDLEDIGEGLFYGLDQLYFAYLGVSCSIGEDAFAGCPTLSMIIFWGNAPQIAENSFRDVYASAWYYEDTDWCLSDFKDYGGKLIWLEEWEEPDWAGVRYSPESVTAEEGETVKFLAASSGDNACYWQYRTSEDGEWRKSTLPGCNSDALFVTATASRNGYQYRCAYCYDFGTQYTDPATLTVRGVATKPTITTQPKDLTIVSGGDASFTVKATGVDSYQWYWRENSSASWQKSTVSTATTKTLVYKNLTESKSGRQYRCKLTNSAGSVYTKAVTLTVTSAEKPKITTQPKDLSIAAGGDASFTVKATGVTSYQWYWRENSSASWQKSTVSTATTKTLVYKNLTESKSGRQYRCKLTNSVGSTYTKAVTLTVCTKPTITTQPSSKTVSAGTSVRFTVKATGGDLSYQWYYRTSSSGEWKKCTGTGATTRTLTVEAKSYRNGYQYRCKVTNVAGYKYSKTVTLTVK